MSVELSEALAYEAENIDLESIMAQMVSDYEETNNVQTKTTPFQIRNMVLAVKYHKEEVEKLKEMKKLVSQQWDKKIDAKNEQIKQIQDFVQAWIETENKGKKLTLDFATVSISKRKSKLEFNPQKVVEARQFLEQQGILNGFLKQPEIDTSVLTESIKQTMENEYNNGVDMIINQYKEQHPDEKLTKTKENQLKEEYQAGIQERYAAFYGSFMDLKPEVKSLGIRMSK